MTTLPTSTTISLATSRIEVDIPSGVHRGRRRRRLGPVPARGRASGPCVRLPGQALDRDHPRPPVARARRLPRPVPRDRREPPPPPLPPAPPPPPPPPPH